jgi:hypothetical protein
MAPVGRWQNGKDLTWYAKGDSNTLARAMEEERRAVQEEERQRMAEALYVISSRFHLIVTAYLFLPLEAGMYLFVLEFILTLRMRASPRTLAALSQRHGAKTPRRARRTECR